MAEPVIGSDGVRTGRWVDAQVNAAPITSRAKHKFPSIVLRIAVSRDDCSHGGEGSPKPQVARRLKWAPCTLNDPAVRRVLVDALDGNDFQEAASELRSHPDAEAIRALLED